MKTKLTKPLLSIGFGALVFAGFAGSISGSLAWWAYSTRVSIGYHGTSVASSEQLQIGIKTRADLSSLGMTQVWVGEDDDETPYVDERTSYYFCDAGTGLQAEVIARYLRYEHQYAIDELVPVTSGSYAIDDALSLKGALVSGVPFNSSAAEKDKYVFIPLAFRIMKYDSNNQLQPVKGENIWLSETMVEASTVNDGDVYKAIRMYTEGYEATTVDDVTTLSPVRRLINPSSTSNTRGQTAVAGLLDIGGSGFYDTYEYNGENYAIVYGESNLTQQQLIAAEDEKQEVGDSGIVDFNETGNDTEKSTFVSRYAEGTFHPHELSDISPKYQVYDTLGSVKPNDSSSGVLSGGKPLAATDLTNGIADLDLTIWLEGWDHNVIDKENRHSFNLGLQFMISRL